MATTIICTNCQKKWALKTQPKRDFIKCPNCQHRIDLPGQTSSKPAVAAPRASEDQRAEPATATATVAAQPHSSANQANGSAQTPPSPPRGALAKLRAARRCQTCGQPLAERVAAGTILGAGRGWRWQRAKICLGCTPLPCMVDGCDGRAVKAYPRHFSVGTGRMTADVRNDLFVCPEHQRIIGRRMRLGQIGLLAIVAAPILLLVVYKTTGSGGSWPLILGAGGVIAAVFWSITATIKLEKKQEFIEQVKGEYGSVWHEDVYCR